MKTRKEGPCLHSKKVFRMKFSWWSFLANQLRANILNPKLQKNYNLQRERVVAAIKKQEISIFFFGSKIPYVHNVQYDVIYDLYEKGQNDRTCMHFRLFCTFFKSKNTFLNTKTTKYWYLQKKKEDYLKRL